MCENVRACECAHKLCESVFVNIGAVCVCVQKRVITTANLVQKSKT